MNTNDERTAFPFENETQRFLRERLRAAKSAEWRPRRNAEPGQGRTEGTPQENATGSAFTTTLRYRSAAPVPPAGKERSSLAMNPPAAGSAFLFRKPMTAAMIVVMAAAAVGASAGFYFASVSASAPPRPAEAPGYSLAAPPAADTPVESPPPAAAASDADTVAHRLAAVRKIAAEDGEAPAARHDAARGENRRPAPRAAPAAASSSAGQPAASCSAASRALSLCD